MKSKEAERRDNMKNKLWKGFILAFFLILFSVTSLMVEAADESYEATIGNSKNKSMKTYTMEVGDKVDFNYYGVKNQKTHSFYCKWKSSNKKVATVNKNGKVTALAEGKTTITVTIKDKTINKKYKVQSLKITVKEKPVSYSKTFQSTGEKVTIGAGESVYLLQKIDASGKVVVEERGEYCNYFELHNKSVAYCNLASGKITLQLSPTYKKGTKLTRTDCEASFEEMVDRTYPVNLWLNVNIDDTDEVNLSTVLHLEYFEKVNIRILDDKQGYQAVYYYAEMKKDAFTYVIEGICAPAEYEVNDFEAVPEATATPTPTKKPKATATPTPTKKPKATPTPTPAPTKKPKATPTPKPAQSASGAYTAYDSYGEEKLSAKPGFASTVIRKESFWTEKNEPGITIYIQDLESWSGGALTRSSRTVDEEEGTASYVYEFTGSYDEDLLKEYFTYLEKFDIVKGKSYSNSAMSFITYYVWQGFTYNGTANVTKGLLTSNLIGEADIEIWRQKSSETVGITVPKEIGLKDFGDRAAGKGGKAEEVSKYTNLSLVSADMTDSGRYRFILEGWSGDSSDYLTVQLHPDIYEKGDVFNLEGFKKQENAGNGALYLICLQADSITDGWYWSPDEKYGKYFQDIEVTVLDKTDSVTAIQFMIKLQSHRGDLVTLEGVFAVETDNVQMPDGSGGESSDSGAGIYVPTTNTRRCNVCQGTGNQECHTCGGDGWKSCTLCDGTGTYRAYGYSSDCSCLNGKVRCSKCRGVGSFRCNGCGGDGLY